MAASNAVQIIEQTEALARMLSELRGITVWHDYRFEEAGHGN